MGRQIIPEQVQYFCDGCGQKLTKSNHDDFVIAINEALRDFSGSKMSENKEVYELCGKCESSFKSWLKEIQR